MKNRNWILVLFAILVTVTLIYALSRERRGARCDYDGTRIQPIYEIDVTLEDGSVKRFCSVVCARSYLKNKIANIKYVTVTDEVTGNKLDAFLAFYVESNIVTIPHVENNIHVFAKQEDARRHARQYNGKLIPNPFKEFFQDS